jgi:hypothetical protein
MFIGCRLMLNKYVDITIIPGSGFQAVEHIAEILAK